MEKPPVMEEPKNLRFAASLNLVLPGAGQFYLGRRMVGCLFATGFVACLVTMLTMFLAGYSEYLDITMSTGILRDRRLEQIGSVFHAGWQIVLLVFAIGIYLGSLVGISLHRQRGNA